jgi:hypothetical protein
VAHEIKIQLPADIDWPQRYRMLLDNAWTAGVVQVPDPAEMSAALMLAEELRQGLAAGLLTPPTPPTAAEPQLLHRVPDCACRYAAGGRIIKADTRCLHDILEHRPGDGPTGAGDADLIAAAAPARLCGCRIRPNPHLHPLEELDEPNAEQADPIPNLRTCRCPGCTAGRIRREPELVSEHVVRFD